MNIITQLTSEQESLIPAYIDKWQQIAFSTEPTDKEKAKVFALLVFLY